MPDGQLALELGQLERPFYFVVVCARCGRAHARVLVEDGDWNAAEKWAYLAHVEHDARCARMYARASTTPTPPTQGA